MTVHVQIDPADEGLGLPGRMTLRRAEGMDAAEITLRWSAKTGPLKVLGMLVEATAEAVVQARTMRALHDVRTYVLSGSWHEGVEASRAAGVKPFAKTTTIITTPEATRGIRLRETDRVLLARPSARVREAWRFVEETSR